MNPGQSPLLKDAWTVNELARELPLTRFGALSPWLPVDIRVQVARFGSGGLWLLVF
jgi:hypothetical protein